MQSFLIRLLIVVLVIYLVEKLVGALELKPPTPKIIFVITLIVGLVWLLFGFSILPLN